MPEPTHLAISNHDVGFNILISFENIDEPDRMILVRAKIYLPHKSLYRTDSATSLPSQLAIVGSGGNLNGQERLVNFRVSGNNHCKWPSAPSQH